MSPGRIAGLGPSGDDQPCARGSRERKRSRYSLKLLVAKRLRLSRGQGIQTPRAASPRIPAKGGAPRADPRRSAFGASLRSARCLPQRPPTFVRRGNVAGGGAPQSHPALAWACAHKHHRHLCGSVRTEEMEFAERFWRIEKLSTFHSPAA
jgi:hypothetical protein